MKKIKLKVSGFEAEILRKFFQSISACRVVQGLEVEHLVLLEWHRKNYLKTQFQEQYKAHFAPHEAISLSRMLSRLGLSDNMAQITRDGILDNLRKQTFNITSATS